jgi:flagellar protein FlgJ
MNPVDFRSLARAPAEDPAAPAPADPLYAGKAKNAAEKFEAFFIADMLHQTRSTTRALADEDSFYQNRINQDMLDMADTVVADVMSHQHAFGIADAILKQVLPAPSALKSGTLAVAPEQSGESVRSSAPAEKVRTE